MDVVVTTEGSPGRRGHTYVAATGVTLLGLSESRDGGGLTGAASGSWTATLALTRAEALRLIEAQNFAREVRLLPVG